MTHRCLFLLRLLGLCTPFLMVTVVSIPAFCDSFHELELPGTLQMDRDSEESLASNHPSKRARYDCPGTNDVMDLSDYYSHNNDNLLGHWQDQIPSAAMIFESMTHQLDPHLTNYNQDLDSMMLQDHLWAQPPLPGHYLAYHPDGNSMEMSEAQGTGFKVPPVQNGGDLPHHTGQMIHSKVKSDTSSEKQPENGMNEAPTSTDQSSYSGPKSIESPVTVGSIPDPILRDHLRQSKEPENQLYQTEQLKTRSPSQNSQGDLTDPNDPVYQTSRVDHQNQGQVHPLTGNRQPSQSKESSDDDTIFWQRLLQLSEPESQLSKIEQPKTRSQSKESQGDVTNPDDQETQTSSFNHQKDDQVQKSNKNSQEVISNSKELGFQSKVKNNKKKKRTSQSPDRPKLHRTLWLIADQEKVDRVGGLKTLKEPDQDIVKQLEYVWRPSSKKEATEQHIESFTQLITQAHLDPKNQIINKQAINGVKQIDHSPNNDHADHQVLDEKAKKECPVVKAFTELIKRCSVLLDLSLTDLKIRAFEDLPTNDEFFKWLQSHAFDTNDGHSIFDQSLSEDDHQLSLIKKRLKKYINLDWNQQKNWVDPIYLIGIWLKNHHQHIWTSIAENNKFYWDYMKLQLNRSKMYQNRIMNQRKKS
ncbi:hypothetical protein Pst134EA_011257 [Puccinia striiformis f. sp. tritici]|uniref:hypothetical protein n=1 Tax=Puccinia striiformis f. sp. tritici TaxID=168172 RepID=UPI00200735C9|nr:hypothetical protein Pst134EA_011257 [Puccinia striiformis f. sp. tritici]KAH9467619.1 hypothetical protein Pst134EA_011257 [Puccinia striiformis f. sp. tritici]